VIAIVDYGMGNLGSVYNMLRRVNVDARVTSDPSVIREAEKIVLPGVGAFDNGMKSIALLGLKEVLDEAVLGRGTPVLGICLGMQLMTARSEEGELPGLNWIKADTIRFRFPEEKRHLKVPHMGWNSLVITRENPLLACFEEKPRFYFVHSYYVSCRDPNDLLATCEYGIVFPAAIACGNIMGTQFHPEKSHRFGMRVLKNFAEMAP